MKGGRRAGAPCREGAIVALIVLHIVPRCSAAELYKTTRISTCRSPATSSAERAARLTGLLRQTAIIRFGWGARSWRRSWERGQDSGAAVVVAMQILWRFAAALLFRRLVRAMGLIRFRRGAVVASYLLGTSLYGSEAHLNALMLDGGNGFALAFHVCSR